MKSDFVAPKSDLFLPITQQRAATNDAAALSAFFGNNDKGFVVYVAWTRSVPVAVVLLHIRDLGVRAWDELRPLSHPLRN